MRKKIVTRTINNDVAALTPLVDTAAFECRQPEIGGWSQQSNDLHDGELSALVAATCSRHSTDTGDMLSDE